MTLCTNLLALLCLALPCVLLPSSAEFLMAVISSTTPVSYMIIVHAVRCAAAACLLISGSTHRPNACYITGGQAGDDDAHDQTFLVGPVQAMAAARHVDCPAA